MTSCQGSRLSAVSIHAPRVGSDDEHLDAQNTNMGFNPRSPCGERPGGSTVLPVMGLKFQSTLPVWGATAVQEVHKAVQDVSIHAPRVGSDNKDIWITVPSAVFQSTLPVWGATANRSDRCNREPRFQSTLPVWGATSCVCTFLATRRCFNPRSPCGERHWPFQVTKARQMVSIHAPRVGSDGVYSEGEVAAKMFQSTLPVWGATGSLRILWPTCRRFNPRSPCGERPSSAPYRLCAIIVSIHAPRVGSDPQGYSQQDLADMFQSTLPVWGATARNAARCRRCPVSIHAPRVGSDSFKAAKEYDDPQFQSTLPVWGATGSASTRSSKPPRFNPRSPCGERRRTG